MTRGFFTFEENNRITKAVELSGSAYLQDGYGEEIVEAYKNGKEESYFKSLYKQMNSEQKKELSEICPSWYRETETAVLNNVYSDYGYVIRNGKLYVYNSGVLLFSVKRDTAAIWLFVIRNLTRCYWTYLYDKEKMSVAYEKSKSMFSMLKKKIEKGYTADELEKELCPKDFCPLILDNYHCMDVWYREKQPAYIKTLQIEGRTIEFIVSMQFNKWRVYLQLPYIRVSILQKYKSEQEAVQHLRQFILSADSLELTRFADVFEYVKKKLKEVSKETFSVEKQREELTAMYRKQKWFCTGIPFTVDDIMREISEKYLRIKQTDK